jgi:hypothetical protein
MHEKLVKAGFGDANGLLDLVECERLNVDWL